MIENTDPVAPVGTDPDAGVKAWLESTTNFPEFDEDDTTVPDDEEPNTESDVS